MTYAARRVPADWEHPRDSDGKYIPLRYGPTLKKKTARWDEEAAQWARGLCSLDLDPDSWSAIPQKYTDWTYTQWNGPRPDPKDYTPDWPESQCTHWQLYEQVTEGTPVSPVLPSAQELAAWLVDHEVLVTTCVADGTVSRRPWSYEEVLDLIETTSRRVGGASRI